MSSGDKFSVPNHENAILTDCLSGIIFLRRLTARTGRELPYLPQHKLPYLNINFNDYQPVNHDGANFWSAWISERRSPSDFPLPSYNWYQATPQPTIVSEDGGLCWRNARLQVHCFVIVGHMGTRYYHYHPHATEGTTEIVQCTPGGGGPVDNYGGDGYDPYGPSDCTDSGAGGGTQTCTDEYVVIERNDGEGWYVWWEGYVTVCS